MTAETNTSAHILLANVLKAIPTTALYIRKPSLLVPPWTGMRRSTPAGVSTGLLHKSAIPQCVRHPRIHGLGREDGRLACSGTPLGVRS